MRYQWRALFVIALLALFAAVLPLPASTDGTESPDSENPDAAPVQYCYDSKNACANAQRAASGTKSGCYQQGNQWCYDLFP